MTNMRSRPERYVNIAEAKARLSELVEKAASGENRHRAGSQTRGETGPHRPEPRRSPYAGVGEGTGVDCPGFRRHAVRFRRLHAVRVLLDTHAFLWWIEGTPALGRRARAAVANPDNEVLFSLASCWELAIKHNLGKLRVPGSLDRFIPEQLTLNGFALLGVELRHVLRVANFRSTIVTPSIACSQLKRSKSSSRSSPPTACFASTV